MLPSSSSWHYVYVFNERVLVIGIGEFIANRMIQDDPYCNATRLEVYAPMRFLRSDPGRSVTLAENEGEDGEEEEGEAEDDVTKRMKEIIIGIASQGLAQKNFLGCDKKIHAERIRNAFNSGRLTFRSQP